MANLAGAYNSSDSYYPKLTYTISASEVGRNSTSVTYRFNCTVSMRSSGGYGYDMYLNYNIGGVTGSRTLKTTSGGFPSSTGNFDVTVSTNATGGTNAIGAQMWSSSSNDSTHWQNAFNTGQRYLDKSSFNTAPTMNSASVSGIGNGAIVWENTSSVTVNYSASDNDGNISTYEIVRYVNDGVSATFTTTGGSYNDTGLGGIGEGAKIQYRVRCYDAYGLWSTNEAWTGVFYKNRFTGASVSSVNPSAQWVYAYIPFGYSGASNSNGNGNHRYQFWNDAGLTIYNNGLRTSFSANQIDISGWGGTDGGRPYFINTDLINFVKDTPSRTRNFTLYLRTFNDTGNYRDSAITITVSMKPGPSAPGITGLAGQITASGASRYVPNVGGTYTLSWNGSTDHTGGTGLSYEVQANFNGGGWYAVQAGIQGTSVDISNDVKRYSFSTAVNYKVRVRAYTTYGTDAYSGEASITLDYWYPPTISIGKVTRANTSYSAPITANVNSSFATISTASWSGNGASGNLTKSGDSKSASGTASQTITANTTFTLSATVTDNSGLSGATQGDSVVIPRYQPIISMRSLGLGVNAYADATFILKVGGNAKANGFYTSHGPALSCSMARIHGDDGTSPDNINNGYAFNYGVSSGVYGPLLSFGSLHGNEGYPMQITGSYQSGNEFKVRTKNGDNGTWHGWRTLLHDGNFNTTAPTFGGNVTCYQLVTTSNGSGYNIRPGDDIWIGDHNQENSMKLTGISDGRKAWIKFGDGPSIGYNAGSHFEIGGSTYMGGNVVAHRGVSGTPSWDNNSMEIRSGGADIASLCFHRPGYTNVNMWHAGARELVLDFDAQVRGNVYTPGEMGGVWGFEPNRGNSRSRLAQADTNGNLRIELFPNQQIARTYTFAGDSFYPNGSCWLGHQSYRWGQIYSTSGSISTSDSKLKENIKPIQLSKNKTRALDLNNNPTGEDMWEYVKNTNTYSFNYKAKYNKDTQPWIGILADEVPDNIFNLIGLMSKDENQYNEEIAKKEECSRLHEKEEKKLSDKQPHEINEKYNLNREYGEVVIEEIGLTRREIKEISEKEVEPPVRMINSSAQIAMLQQVIGMALNEIESLKEENGLLKTDLMLIKERLGL